jgi:hypothetical protein
MMKPPLRSTKIPLLAQAPWGPKQDGDGNPPQQELPRQEDEDCPSIRDLSPLTDRVEIRLSAITSFLSYGDRLVLVNSVLSSLPTYFMLSLRLPPGIIEVIDRARRHCLWKRKDKNKVNSLAA